MFWDTNVYKDVSTFLFFGHKDISNFLTFHLKLYTYIYIFFFTPFFFKILGPFFYLRALDNDLIGLVEGLTPVKILY